MIFVLRKDDSNRPTVLRNVLRTLGELPDHKTFTITVSDAEATRSKQQNAYFHVLRDLIAEFGGWSKSEIKKRLKIAALGYEVFNKDGKDIFILKETSDLTVDEFSELIDHTTAVAADLGVKIPLPSYYGSRE